MKRKSGLLKGSLAVALMFSFSTMNIVHAAEPVDGVAKIGEQEFSTIIEALKASQNGDTIVVNGRVYWGGNDENHGQENDLKTVTITNGKNGAVVMNGANGYNDKTPNITHLDCGVVFKDVTVEESAGVNYLYANGNHLNFENVTFVYNNSVTSGETSGPYWSLIGGSDREAVKNTEMLIGINNARISSVVGGGINHDVHEDTNVKITSGYSVYNVYGGGAQGNVGGRATLDVNNASNVIGGSFRGNVGSTDLTIRGEVSIYSIYAGSQHGHVVGDTHVTVANGATAGVPLHGGSTTENKNPWNGNWRGEFNFTNMDLTKLKSFVGGDTHVTVNGIAKQGVYGGSNAPVEGDTYVTINGTVYGTFNSEGVYGGGSIGGGDITGDTHVFINETASIPMSFSKCITNSKIDCLIGGAVFGGGRFSKVHGNTYVTVNARVGTEGLGGLVLGGGYASSNDIGETAYVEINAAPYAYTNETKYGWQQYSKYDFLKGLSGVYGGGFNNPGTHDAVVNINVDLGETAVFGDGLCGYVNNTTININKDGAAKTIWGYYNEEGDGRSVQGKANVVFTDNNDSETRQILNADLVDITNDAKVVIDNEMKDNEQFVNVYDLNIHENGQLTLGASAQILGNYAGDKESTGTLVLPAGKGLTVDGTITDLTKVSIVDAKDGTVPAKQQVYIISKAGSTTDAGDFSWIDRRNSVTMEWKDITDGMSQWWLVGYYSVTVNYINQDTGEIIRPNEMIELKEGLEYDMSEYDALVIEGYTYQETEGTVVGVADDHKVINVYYTEDEVMGDEEEPEPTVPETPDVEEPEPTVPDEDEVLGDKEEPEAPVVETPNEDEVLGDTGKPDTSDTNAMNMFAMTMMLGAMGFVALKKRKES